MRDFVARLRRSRMLAQMSYVAVGLLVQAATAYATLIAAGRLLGAARFAGLAVLYVMVSSLPTGLFQPLEQEVSRRRGVQWNTGEPEAGLLARALGFGSMLSLLTGAVVLAAGGFTVRLLDGQPQLLAAFVVAMPGYALCYVSRGALSGARRLKRYAVQLAAEGLFRLAGVAVLAPLGVRGPAAFGWLFGLAPWVAFAVSMIGLPRSSAHPPAPDASTAPEVAGRTGQRGRPLVRPLLLLLASALAAQVIIGAGPVTTRVFAGPHESGRASAFLAALVVVRIPIFLFTAVQPSMLPAMAAHVSAGRKAAFRTLLVKVMAMMGLLTVLTVAAITLAGPFVLALLFGAGFVLGPGVLALMGLSVGLFLIATVLAQTILARGEHRGVALGWMIGLVGLALGTALTGDAIMRATYGLLVGAGVAALAFAVLLARTMRRWRPIIAAPVPAHPALVLERPVPAHMAPPPVPSAGPGTVAVADPS